MMKSTPGFREQMRDAVKAIDEVTVRPVGEPVYARVSKAVAETLAERAIEAQQLRKETAKANGLIPRRRRRNERSAVRVAAAG